MVKLTNWCFPKVLRGSNGADDDGRTCDDTHAQTDQGGDVKGVKFRSGMSNYRQGGIRAHGFWLPQQIGPALSKQLKPGKKVQISRI